MEQRACSMALEKQKILLNGSEGNYWKVISESYNKSTLTCTWIIALFKDKATCDSGNPGLGLQKTFTYHATRSELSGDRSALAYNQIKLQSSKLVKPAFGSGALFVSDPDLNNALDV